MQNVLVDAIFNATQQLVQRANLVPLQADLTRAILQETLGTTIAGEIFQTMTQSEMRNNATVISTATTNRM